MPQNETYYTPVEDEVHPHLVPVISPIPHDGQEWRVATDDEVERYRRYWDTFHDALGVLGLSESASLQYAQSALEKANQS